MAEAETVFHFWHYDPNGTLDDDGEIVEVEGEITRQLAVPFDRTMNVRAGEIICDVEAVFYDPSEDLFYVEFNPRWLDDPRWVASFLSELIDDGWEVKSGGKQWEPDEQAIENGQVKWLQALQQDDDSGGHIA